MRGRLPSGIPIQAASLCSSLARYTLKQSGEVVHASPHLPPPPLCTCPASPPTCSSRSSTPPLTCPPTPASLPPQPLQMMHPLLHPSTRTHTCAPLPPHTHAPAPPPLPPPWSHSLQAVMRTDLHPPLPHASPMHPPPPSQCSWRCPHVSSPPPVPHAGIDARCIPPPSRASPVQAVMATVVGPLPCTCLLGATTCALWTTWHAGGTTCNWA